MKQYKGSFFNSVNIGLLNGELGRVVSANNIRTAVVSRKTRTECKKFMKARIINPLTVGISYLMYRGACKLCKRLSGRNEE